MITGLDPIVDENTHTLILGSMPSVNSLAKKEYYGNVTNRFWSIMQFCFDMPITSYREKLLLLHKQGIGVWDTIAQCERQGSLDSNITNIVVNQLDVFLQFHQNITCLICNGKKSYVTLKKHFPHLMAITTTLPSTSNANRLIGESELFNLWKQALKQ